MIKTKEEYFKNNDIVAHKGLSYFSSIAIIDVNEECCVWFYQTDSKPKIESIEDINISEVHFFDDSIECTCNFFTSDIEEDQNCDCEQSMPFFYDIDDDDYKESNRENYSKIYLNECMKVRY